MRRNTAVFIALAMFLALQARGADFQHDVGLSGGYFAASDANIEDGWVTNFNWEVHAGSKLAFRVTLGTIGTDFTDEALAGREIDFNIKWYGTLSMVLRGQRKRFNPHVLIGLGAYKLDPVMSPDDNPEDSQVFHFGPHAGFGASLRAGEKWSIPLDVQMHWVIDKKLQDLGVTITAGLRRKF
jgi:hypothetical protein